MQLARKITLPLALSAFLALGFSAWLSVREAVELHHADIERDQSVSGRVFLAALERERQQGTAVAGIERQHILRVLRAVGGHRTQAARILGLDRKTLYRKLEGYGPQEVDTALRNAPPRQIASSEN